MKDRNIIIEKIRGFFDSLLCLYYFPSMINIIYFFKVAGLINMAEKTFLYVMARYLSIEGDILEIGSFAGSSSIILAEGNRLCQRKCKIWLIEPEPQPSKEAFLNVFIKKGLGSDIQLIDKISEHAKKDINARFKFIFVDGNHEYEYVKKDILLWKDSLNDGGIIAFHDIVFDGVKRAIKELITDTNNFKVLGNVSGILYASKGNFADSILLSKLSRFNNFREKLMKMAKAVGLGNDNYLSYTQIKDSLSA